MIDFFKRILKHRWLDASDVRKTVTTPILERLTERVAASEQQHSGQIRICIEASLPMSYLGQIRRGTSVAKVVRVRALTMFSKLRVWDTQHNNGVLIYLLLAENAIEVVADRGLNAYVPPEEWQAMVERLGQAFKERRYEEGLMQAVDEVSSVLAEHFALAEGQTHADELPNAPVMVL